MSAAPAGFVEVRRDRTTMWIRPELQAVTDALLAAWDGVAGEWVGGGRAAHPLVALPEGGKAVVRRYLRGGLVRHLNRDRYFRGDRAAHEAWILDRGRSAGVLVPETVAFGRSRAFPGYRAMLATRFVEGARDGEAVLRGRGDRPAFLARLGGALARMHEAGIGHPDLNLRNVLEDAHHAIWLIDFDRATLTAGGAPASARRSNLLRLARSALRLGVPFSAEDLDHLRTGYGTRWPLRR